MLNFAIYSAVFSIYLLRSFDQSMHYNSFIFWLFLLLHTDNEAGSQQQDRQRQVRQHGDEAEVGQGEEKDGAERKYDGRILDVAPHDQVAKMVQDWPMIRQNWALAFLEWGVLWNEGRHTGIQTGGANFRWQRTRRWRTLNTNK